MSILKNYIAEVEQGKFSTPDKPQYRVKVGDKFFTLYSDRPPTVNSFCELEMRTSKQGNDYIYSWRYISEDGTVPSGGPDPVAATVSHMTEPTPAQRAVANVFKPADQSLSIMTQSAFKALMENASDNIDHPTIMEYAKLSVKTARYWDKALKAYMAGGDPRAALEDAEQQTQSATPPPANDFDDEIPF